MFHKQHFLISYDVKTAFYTLKQKKNSDFKFQTEVNFMIVFYQINLYTGTRHVLLWN